MAYAVAGDTIQSMPSKNSSSSRNVHGSNRRGTKKPRFFLVGDVGGTKTRTAIYCLAGGQWIRGRTRTVPSDSPGGPLRAIADFVKRSECRIEAACFGVPGPVQQGHFKATNLDWAASEEGIQRELGLPAVRLVNDLVATAASIPFLTRNNWMTLHRGVPAERSCRRCAVLAPGTGLGEAVLVLEDEKRTVHPSEGGHAGFAPGSELAGRLYHFIHARQGRVSWEDLLAGSGFLKIYEFFRDEVGLPEPSDLRERLELEEPAKVISDEGMGDGPEICAKTMDLYVSMLGAHAGDLALVHTAMGGVFLGGGIPPKILGKLAEGGLLAAYLDKGEMSSLVRQVPLRVILDDRAALLGAASLAAELCS